MIAFIKIKLQKYPVSDMIFNVSSNKDILFRIVECETINVV